MPIDAIDDLLQTYVPMKLCGAALAVIHHGEVLHQQCYGMADVEWQCATTAQTVFHLASLTKPFTAMAILLLEQ